LTVGEYYRSVRNRFRAAGMDTADMDARLLVAFAAGMAPMDLFLREDDPLPQDIRSAAEELASARLSGVPTHRILGEREFFGLTFRLNSATLEPRPDTETLVEAVLARTQPNDAFTFADLGTGTGAIAISLLVNRQNARGVAVDLSGPALECAYDNAQHHGVGDRVLFAQSDYAAAVGGDLDWIISNPPYIATPVIQSLDESVRKHDPVLALDGGQDGLDAYRTIANQARGALRPGGSIGLEIGFDQAESVSHLLAGSGYKDIEITMDLSGNPRVVLARLGAA